MGHEETNKGFFKEKFSDEEVKALAAWFDDKMTSLPKAMQINVSTSTDDLHKTVDSLLRIIKSQLGNGELSVTYSGYVAHLLVIRQKLIDIHPEWAEKA